MTQRPHDSGLDAISRPLSCRKILASVGFLSSESATSRDDLTACKCRRNPSNAVQIDRDIDGNGRCRIIDCRRCDRNCAATNAIRGEKLLGGCISRICGSSRNNRSPTSFVGGKRACIRDLANAREFDGTDKYRKDDRKYDGKFNGRRTATCCVTRGFSD